jgi:hypothetical protein
MRVLFISESLMITDIDRDTFTAICVLLRNFDRNQ